jgi:HptB-dependent secretion and biofilm anti anti-sigma factor
MFEVHHDHETCHVKLDGRFDFTRVSQFQDLFGGGATGGSPRQWVVDLSEVVYVDSSALGVLLMLRDRSGEGRRVVLRGARGQPRDVLLMAKFDQLFELE